MLAAIGCTIGSPPDSLGPSKNCRVVYPMPAVSCAVVDYCGPKIAQMRLSGAALVVALPSRVEKAQLQIATT
jgi:hypothetical protein